MSSAAEQLGQVIEFRNRLVLYMNLVNSQGDTLRWGGAAIDQDAVDKLQAEQPWLAHEYGRLFKIINRWGGMMMSSPAAGVTSRDVIQDAIHDVRDVYYRDLARLSVQHLDMVIGRLTAELEESAGGDPDRWYRWTSPLYWLGQLAALVRWIIGTTRGRIVGIVSVVVVAIIGGIASGIAQGWYESLFK